MKRKSFYLGIDTETTNSLTTEDGKLDLSNSLVYDVGWQIIDRKGRPYVTRSYVVAEIFLDKPLTVSYTANYDTALIVFYRSSNDL